MDISDTQLYQNLAELEYIPAADLKKAQEAATSQGISLYDALINEDLVSDQNLGQLIALTLQLPYIGLGQESIPEEILRITPQPVAEQFRVITFAASEQELRIATNAPGQNDLFGMLAKKAGKKNYRVFFATGREIEEALRLYRKQLQNAFDELLSSKAAGSELPVAKIVNTIIEYAQVNKTSDVHIEPSRTSTLVRFRIDGVLHDIVRLPRTVHDQVISRVKVLARLRTDEHYSAQDGRMRVKLEDEDIDVRVSVVPIVGGEKVVMRLLAAHTHQFGLTDLGMQEADLLKVKEGFSRPYGMVLSTGPTGSGKTTSMYSILKILNTRDRNIATIEDPVEYEIDGINQIQANTKTNLTFANGLRSILRQDPDIIYVGEIRDEETADIAINSAMTGHLVLSTLHTNDAATALPRFIDMKIEPFLVATTVNVIIGQRLVRKICSRCKVSVELAKDKTVWKGDAKIAAQLNAFPADAINKHFGATNSIRLYHGKGCNICHQTGYVGRVGVFEVLNVSPKIQTLITQKANSEQITAQAVKEGMTTMQDDGLGKVRQGLTTLEEILRATRE